MSPLCSVMILPDVERKDNSFFYIDAFNIFFYVIAGSGTSVEKVVKM